MYSIVKSFSDCPSCKLFQAPSCFLETNCEDDLSKVDFIGIAENPGKNEVEGQFKKGEVVPTPLIGRAGQTFREYFDLYIKENFSWLLTNVVLCLTLDKDGNTGNPDDETINRCKLNCFNLIKVCHPKLVFLMGGSALKAFFGDKSTIMKERGKLLKWNDIDFLPTVHPSFVNRNQSARRDFEYDFRRAKMVLEGQKMQKRIVVSENDERGIHFHEIDKKFYENDFRLVDIQYMKEKEKCLYIFRDKDNKKHSFQTNNDYLYYTTSGEEGKLIVPYDELYQKKCKYSEKYSLDPLVCYHGDMRLTSQKALDYYHFSKGEADISDFNIAFLDIEIDTGKKREFPDPTEAKFPVCLLTLSFQKKKTTYVIDNKTEKIKDFENVEIKIFEDERKLLTAFAEDFRNFDPDFVAGWNVISFDLAYLFNRTRRISLRFNISKYGPIYVDGNRYIANIPGCVAIDQLHLYKNFTFTKLEQYKLDFVAKKELNKGKEVIDIPFNEQYSKCLNEFIRYNIVDVELIEEMEEKLGHIKLLNEIRLICRGSFEGSSSSFGQVDNLIVGHLRDQNLASRNSDTEIEKGKYSGAYVHEPKAGLYDWITDFDFTSLYPSIIMTYNLGCNNFIAKLKDHRFGYDLAYSPESLPDEIDVIIDPMFKKEKKTFSKNQLFDYILKNNLIHTINGAFFTQHEKEKSVYSQVLGHLLSSRKSYKKRMLDAKEAGNKNDERLFNTKQLVYKVLANSLYGVIANKAFRFFDLTCASAITLSGQEALKNSIIHGSAIMEKLDRKLDEVPEKPILTRKEAFSDKMPERNSKYIVTGDTDSIFCCFSSFKGEKSVEVISEYCQQIQNFLNFEIIPEMVKKHNIENMNYNRLNLKNELIISRGLFLGKKMYAIRIISQEGRKVDYISYMGIQVKRSDTPSKTKDVLKEILNKILLSEKISFQDLIRFKMQREEEFRRLILSRSNLVCKPVGYGKKLESYKTVPQQVVGMENWNKLMYKTFNVGDRGYLWLIKGIDLCAKNIPANLEENYKKYFTSMGKTIDKIVVPVDEKLPEFIIPDSKEMLKKNFDSRFDLLLKPLIQANKTKGIMRL